MRVMLTCPKRMSKLVAIGRDIPVTILRHTLHNRGVAMNKKYNRLVYPITMFLSYSLLIFISLQLISTSASSVEARPAPEITAPTWLNSQPLTLAELKGKVVMLKFWTFGCYNCNNVEPYVKAWYKTYKDKGLEVIAVHSPEFNYEKSIKNVKKYIQDKGVTYPIAIDNDFITWHKYQNRAWPTMYLIDKHGFIRHKRIGEGGYTTMESMIQKLLAEK